MTTFFTERKDLSIPLNSLSHPYESLSKFIFSSMKTLNSHSQAWLNIFDFIAFNHSVKFASLRDMIENIQITLFVYQIKFNKAKNEKELKKHTSLFSKIIRNHFCFMKFIIKKETFYNNLSSSYSFIIDILNLIPHLEYIAEKYEMKLLSEEIINFHQKLRENYGYYETNNKYIFDFYFQNLDNPDSSYAYLGNSIRKDLEKAREMKKKELEELNLKKEQEREKQRKEQEELRSKKVLQEEELKLKIKNEKEEIKQKKKQEEIKQKREFEEARLKKKQEEDKLIKELEEIEINEQKEQEKEKQKNHRENLLKEQEKLKLIKEQEELKLIKEQEEQNKRKQVEEQRRKEQIEEHKHQKEKQNEIEKMKFAENQNKLKDQTKEKYRNWKKQDQLYNKTMEEENEFEEEEFFEDDYEEVEDNENDAPIPSKSFDDDINSNILLQRIKNHQENANYYSTDFHRSSSFNIMAIGSNTFGLNQKNSDFDFIIYCPQSHKLSIHKSVIISFLDKQTFNGIHFKYSNVDKDYHYLLHFNISGKQIGNQKANVYCFLEKYKICNDLLGKQFFKPQSDICLLHIVFKSIFYFFSGADVCFLILAFLQKKFYIFSNHQIRCQYRKPIKKKDHLEVEWREKYYYSLIKKNYEKAMRKDIDYLLYNLVKYLCEVYCYAFTIPYKQQKVLDFNIDPQYLFSINSLIETIKAYNNGDYWLKIRNSLPMLRNMSVFESFDYIVDYYNFFEENE